MGKEREPIGRYREYLDGVKELCGRLGLRWGCTNPLDQRKRRRPTTCSTTPFRPTLDVRRIAGVALLAAEGEL